MVTSGKDPKVDFPSRLNQALDAAGFAPEGAGRQQALAKKLDVSQQAAGKWLRGETLPELGRVIEIALFTGRNVEWLLTGRGPARARRPAATTGFLTNESGRQRGPCQDVSAWRYAHPPQHGSPQPNKNKTDSQLHTISILF